MPSDRVVVIGGGPAGLEAGRLAAELGAPVTIVEKRSALGGMPIHENYAALTHGFRSATEAMAQMIDAANAQPTVEVRTDSEVVGVAGEAGNFTVTITSNGTQDTLDAGAIVLATGFQHFDPGRETQQYG